MQQTIIQFIGLIVFATGFGGGMPNERIMSTDIDTAPVVAILPRITGASGPAMQRMHSHAASAEPVDVQSEDAQSGVEAHTALLTFASCDLLAVSGWELKELGDTGFLYIEWNGEHLTINADRPNGPVTPSDSKDLGLGRLGGTLADPFTAKTGYSGAAAVVTLTQGTLSTCGKPSDNGNPRRVDTLLTLNAAKKVTISAGGKSVTLRAGGRSYFGNVPTAALNKGYRMTGSMHYEVYCAMTGRNCSEVKTNLYNASSNATCGESPVGRTPYSKAPGPPPIFARIDFACSNSSYP